MATALFGIEASEEERARANAMGQAFEKVLDRVERSVSDGPLDERRRKAGRLKLSQHKPFGYWRRFQDRPHDGGIQQGKSWHLPDRFAP
jgi:hypothetical protein